MEFKKVADGQLINTEIGDNLSAMKYVKLLSWIVLIIKLVIICIWKSRTEGLQNWNWESSKHLSRGI